MICGGPEFGFNAKDTGIDLVAKTQGTEEYQPSKKPVLKPKYDSRKH